jgi:hypothetical protein
MACRLLGGVKADSAGASCSEGMVFLLAEIVKLPADLILRGRMP